MSVTIGPTNITYNDATTQSTAAPIAPVVNIYTSPAPWTKSPTLKSIKVTVIGGGGGGGGSVNNAGYGGAGGGGGGGIGFFNAADIPGPLTITVGSGGAGQLTTGSTGGTSSFGSLMSASGGVGGPAAPVPSPSQGGAGGAFTPSPGMTIGGRGFAGGSVLFFQGPSPTTEVPAGGSSWGFYGEGGYAKNNGPNPGTGNPATGFGAGGGTIQGTNTGNRTGGNGTGGFVIVEEFY